MELDPGDTETAARTNDRSAVAGEGGGLLEEGVERAARPDPSMLAQDNVPTTLPLPPPLQPLLCGWFLWSLGFISNVTSAERCSGPCGLQ